MTEEKTKVDEAPLSTEDLLKKNLEWSEALYKQNKKILHRMTMMTVANYFRLLLIVVPLILSIIYLPRLLGPMIEQYQQLLGGSGANGKALDIQQLIQQYQSTVK